MANNPNNIHIVYSTDNEAIAQQLIQDVSSILPMQPIAIHREQEASMSDLLANATGKIVLLISDNFLRSTKCMQGALGLLNKQQDNITSLTIPGFRINEEGEQEAIATHFDKVSDIIQYINYWQDRYLELRRQKREDPSLDTPGFAEHLRVIRDISGETGEFLRLLRNQPHTSFEHLPSTKYKAFFQLLEAEELWETYQATQQGEDVPTAVLAAIPGIDLLPTDADASSPGAPIEETLTELPATIEDNTLAESPVLADAQDIAQASPAGTPNSEEVSPTEENIAEEVAELTESLPGEATDSIEEIIEKAWALADSGDAATGMVLLSTLTEKYPE
ncbi:MAG: hypothetical protein R2795_20295, partial [Saprospiraceae bacterium]